MDVKRLYDTLYQQDLLSIGFNEFQEKLKDENYKSKVHKTIVDQNLYSGDFNTFQEQYIPKENEEPVSWFEQTWFGRGFKAASTTGEATDLMSQDFSNINKETVQDFIKAKEEESKTLNQ